MKQWNLTLHLNQSCIQRWKSSEGTLHVGSSTDCELSIPDEQVSARHTALSLGPDYLEVEDLGTPTGTRVNGYDIEGRVQVEYPAAIQIGEYEILIEERRAAQIFFCKSG
jgi:pSer/pThr/pTyr-binding forkhead associated (FHA) protein